jgi:hypothetical protein
LKQEFCREWGGDVYTILQKVFKRSAKARKEGISFEELYEVGRRYGLIFN